MFKKSKKSISGAFFSRPKPPTPKLLPPNSRDARRSTQSLEVIDLICEGPIAGIVDKQGNILSGLDLGKGIYLNDTPIIDDNGKFNFRRTSAEFKQGIQNPELFSEESGFNEMEQSVSKNQNLTGSWNWGEDINEEDSHDGLTSRDVRGSRLFGTWRGAIDESEFPEEDPYIFTHTAENSFVDEIDVSINVSQLFDTVSTGSGRGKSGDLGSKISSTVKFEIKGGYFDAQNNAVEVTSIEKSVTGLITSSPYGITETVEVGTDQTAQKWVSVRKLSAETLSPLVARVASVNQVVERITAPKIFYPYSAMVASKYDARTFSQLPQRTFDCKLKIIRVPSNYDPESSSYNGIWDGAFKWAWSDNPAWILYDLLVNNSYGVGDFLDANLIDKWTLYSLGRYCDAVDDQGNFVGVNGRPRFSCNMIISQPQQAYELINQVAAIFRAFFYWQNGSLQFSSDQPKDTIQSFSNVDVADGQFYYSEAAKNTRFTVAEVQYNDETDNYTPKIEAVEDAEGIAKLGPIIKKVEGLGVTNKDQARRLGLHMIYSSRMETETVSFKTTQKALYLKCGDVISVSDQVKTILRNDGKILGVTTNSEGSTGIVLDQDFTGASVSTIKFATPQSFNNFKDFGNFFGSTVEEQLQSIKDLRTKQFSEYKVGTIRRGNIKTFEMDCSAENMILPLNSSALIFGLTLNRCSSPFVITFDQPIAVGDADVDLTWQAIVDAVNNTSSIVRDAEGDPIDIADIQINYEGSGFWGEVGANEFIDDNIGFSKVEYGFRPIDGNGDDVSISEFASRFENGDYSYVVKLESQNIKESLFKIISIAEEEKNKYNINAAAYNPDKFEAIEGDYVEDEFLYTFGGLNSVTYGINQPNQPYSSTIVSSEASVSATHSNFTHAITWEWNESFDSIERFDLVLITPDGALRYFSKGNADFDSLNNGIYTYSLNVEDLNEAVAEYEFGTYTVEVRAVSKAPYHISSTASKASNFLDTSSGLIVRNKFIVYKLDFNNEENSNYSFNNISGTGDAVLNSADLNVTWILIDPTNKQIKTELDLENSPFNVIQKVSILKSDDSPTSIAGETVSGLGYSATKQQLLAALGSEADLRNYKLRIDLTSSLNNATHYSIIEISNPAPEITAINVADGDDAIEDEVVLTIPIDNNGGNDLQYIEVYGSDAANFTPDSSNLMETKSLSANSTSATVRLTLYDGQSYVEEFPYTGPYVPATEETFAIGFTYYQAIVYDSIGASAIFNDSVAKGAILQSESTTDEIAQINDDLEAIDEEMFTKTDTKGKLINFNTANYVEDGSSTKTVAYSSVEFAVQADEFVRADLSKFVSTPVYSTTSSRFDTLTTNLFFNIGGTLPAADDHELTFLIGGDVSVFESSSDIPVFDENTFGIMVKFFREGVNQKVYLASSFGSGAANFTEQTITLETLVLTEANNYVLVINADKMSLNKISEANEYLAIAELTYNNPFTSAFAANLHGLQFWSKSNSLTLAGEHKNTLETVYYDNHPIDLD